MAKFDEEAWRKRNEREQEEEEARKFLEYQGSDAELDDAMLDILGMSATELQKALEKDIPGMTQKEIDTAIRDAKAARKAMQGGGWLGGKPDPELAEKILMRNGKIIELHKKRKGCVVVALMMLGSASLSIWGLVEGARALLG